MGSSAPLVPLFGLRLPLCTPKGAGNLKISLTWFKFHQNWTYLNFHGDLLPPFAPPFN